MPMQHHRTEQSLKRRMNQKHSINGVQATLRVHESEASKLDKETHNKTKQHEDSGQKRYYDDWTHGK